MARRTRKRTRECFNKSEMKAAIAALKERGYEVQSKSKRSVLLVKKKEKKYHGVIALLTIWWTFGLGNLLYAMWPSRNSDEVLLTLKK